MNVHLELPRTSGMALPGKSLNAAASMEARTSMDCSWNFSCNPTVQFKPQHEQSSITRVFEDCWIPKLRPTNFKPSSCLESSNQIQPFFSSSTVSSQVASSSGSCLKVMLRRVEEFKAGASFRVSTDMEGRFVLVLKTPDFAIQPLSLNPSAMSSMRPMSGYPKSVRALTWGAFHFAVFLLQRKALWRVANTFERRKSGSVQCQLALQQSLHATSQ